MSLDWADAKERVRQAVDIVELVGDYLQLRREGRGYKAICPWYDDSRPSLQVNPERQSFKCWVCDIGGDIFSFIMKMEGVEFAEALRLLADKAGIQLEPRRRPDGTPAPADEKRDMLQALAWAEQRFHAYLLSPEGKPAFDYLTERGLTMETIVKFHCGFSPNSWDWLVQQARQTQFPQAMLAAVGLIAERNTGSGFYDRFRGRVLFSIRDAQSRPVGFGGRVLPGISDDSPAKYVNSPETPLFQKSSLLYGLDVAKESIQKTGTALVMEGYTDVAIAHQYGFTNAVAVLGTALGQRHVKLLKRFADRVVLMLDGDEAGQRRTDEVLQLFIAENADLRVLTLPDELDPADFLLERGPEQFAALMERCPDALEHKYRTLAARCGGAPTLHQSTEIAEAILEVVAKSAVGLESYSKDLSIRVDAAINRLHTYTLVPEVRLRKSLAERRRKAAEGASRDARPTQPEAAGSQVFVEDDTDDASDGPRYMQAETWLMEILVHSPEMLAEVAPVLTRRHLRRAAHRRLYARACELFEQDGSLSFNTLMLEFDEPRMKGMLIDLDEARRAKSRPATVEEVRQLLGVLQERTPTEAVPDAESSHISSPHERSAEFARLQALLKRGRDRQGISVPTEG